VAERDPSVIVASLLSKDPRRAADKNEHGSNMPELILSERSTSISPVFFRSVFDLRA
jgi:hypothetical protein